MENFELACVVAGLMLIAPELLKVVQAAIKGV